MNPGLVPARAPAFAPTTCPAGAAVKPPLFMGFDADTDNLLHTAQRISPQELARLETVLSDTGSSWASWLPQSVRAYVAPQQPGAVKASAILRGEANGFGPLPPTPAQLSAQADALRNILSEHASKALKAGGSAEVPESLLSGIQAKSVDIWMVAESEFEPLLREAGASPALTTPRLALLSNPARIVVDAERIFKKHGNSLELTREATADMRDMLSGRGEANRQLREFRAEAVEASKALELHLSKARQASAQDVRTDKQDPFQSLVKRLAAAGHSKLPHQPGQLNSRGELSKRRASVEPGTLQTPNLPGCTSPTDKACAPGWVLETQDKPSE